MNDTLLIEVYAEMTPNPESIKLVTNLQILPDYQLEFLNMESTNDSALAKAFFELPYVQHVFISGNYVTLTKKNDYDWYEITPELKKLLKHFLESGQVPIGDSLFPSHIPPKVVVNTEYKIKALLQKHIRPAVQLDGGHIEFKSFEDGVVTVTLHGACKGCPSSNNTMKAGVEAMLKRNLPEVKKVIAVEE